MYAMHRYMQTCNIPSHANPRQPTPDHPRQPTPTHAEPHPAARTPAAVISRDLALIDLRSDLAVIPRDLATWAALPSTEQLQIYRTTQ